MRKISLLLVVLLFIVACGGDDEATSSSTTVDGGPSTLSDETTTTSTTTTTMAPVAVDEASWPLTGLPSGDEDVLAAPVVIAKIDNTPSARPQLGLEDADIVFEVLVEGGVARLLAVFQSNIPVEIGPVRSGREVDPKIIEPFGAMMAYSGGQDFIVSRIRAVSADVGLPRLGDAAYYRAPDRPAPYDVVLRTSDVIDTQVGGLENGFLFGELEASPKVPALEVIVSQSNFNEARYAYEDGQYLRSIGENPHEDTNGDQIVATNVVVLFVEVLATGRTDSAGAAVPDYDVVGSGEVIVFRDGVGIEGTWNRASTSDMFAFVDPEGVPIPLAPGNTWVEVVPNGRQVSWN